MFKKNIYTNLMNSDMYKRSTRSQKFPADGAQGGRSMIEMLGVLAIIAVLSVGGIVGYGKAIDKYKTTKLMREYNELIRNLIEYRYNFEKSYSNSVELNNAVWAAGLVPAKWHPEGIRFKDSYGNYIVVKWECYHIKPCSYIVLMFLDSAGIAYGEKREHAKKTCMAIFQNVIKPLHGMLRIGRGTWSLGGNAKTFYGDAYCDPKRQLCLRDMSLADMKSSCDSCDIAGRCEVSMYF